jgi:hypothetical protein
MNSTYRWIVIVGALLLAAMVGFGAWQAGVAHGIEQSGKIVVPPSGGAGAAPAPYPYAYPYYGWHRPFGFGFLFIPFFFLFWFLVVRGLFWRRAGYGPYGGGCGPRGRFDFDEWHRQAHARDAGETAPPAPAAR